MAGKHGGRELWEAVVSGLPKTKDSRLAIITTAGSPGHWSRQVFDRAQREPRWHVSMTHTLAPWIDPVEVEEARRALPASAFARLWENRWAQSEDRLFTAEDVEAAVVLPGPLDYERGRRYAIGVDLALRNDRAAVCVGHVDGDVVRVDAVAGSRR